MKKICDLNITNQDFTKLQQQWKEHVAALLASATPSDIKDMLTKAEKQEGTANKYTYLLLQNENDDHLFGHMKDYDCSPSPPSPYK